MLDDEVACLHVEKNMQVEGDVAFMMRWNVCMLRELVVVGINFLRM